MQNEFCRTILWCEVEGPDEEDGHFGAAHKLCWTVIAVAAPGGDAFVGKLFDPCGGPVIGRDIAEDSAGGGRGVG